MKNQKGFTLIEIIVAMAVGAIFVTCVIALISPTTKIFNRVETSSDARMMTESILEEIRDVANYAGELKAGENGTIIADHSIISINDEGYLVKEDTDKGDMENLFDPKFYAGKTLTMTTVQDGENCVDMTLKVISNGREIYSIDSRLKPVINKSNTFDKYTPEGMLRLARREIADYRKTDKSYEEYGYGKYYPHDGIRRILQKAPQYYEGDYPEYATTKVLLASKVEAFYKKNEEEKPADYWAIRNACLTWMGQKGEHPTRMCCFVTQTTLIPVVYLTASYSNLVNNTHANAIAIYWSGKWYVGAKLETKSPVSFDHKTEEQIKSLIHSWGWIPANEFKP